MSLLKLLGLFLIIMNVIAFFMYGIDKQKARKNKWRISEAALLGVAFFGGSLGALAGMKIFHHKTKHWKFKILVPLFLVLHVGLVIHVSFTSI